jgi:hypothetical protein
MKTHIGERGKGTDHPHADRVRPHGPRRQSKQAYDD